MPGGSESNAPSMKAMATVKYKNNITQQALNRTLTQLEKEKALAILLIDHERLDLRDFLRHIKQCASNDLPESKQLLQEKTVDLASRSSCRTSPANKDDAKPATTERKPVDQLSDLSEKGVFRHTGTFEGQNKGSVHMDIYSRRNMYADLRWVNDYFEREGDDLRDRNSSMNSASTSRTQSDAASGFSSDVRSRINSGVLSASADDGQERDPNLRRLSRELCRSPTRRDSRVNPPTGSDRRAKESKGKSRGQRGTRKQGDFMKELLVRNAQYRYRKSRSKPFDARLKDFYRSVEELLEKEEELTNAELERKWILITKGVKEALVCSSDEEEDENQMHTI